MKDPSQCGQITTICHAIVSICTRFSNDPRLGHDSEARAQKAKRSRDAVILQSMQSFSVENLQALIIVAFDTIGSGRSPSAWSVVGSMTRTVEQLQLSVEPADEEHPRPADTFQNQIKRAAFLPPARDWSELEERRRVFWNVFLMDRFCSIATGWNLSLTSADVKRRLPCEGALWEAGDALETPTPFFGVSDKYNQTSNTSDNLSQHQKHNTQASEMRLPTARAESEDQESLGGFAYCIEATESLSLVTSFFLQQAVDVSKAQDVQMWLMRFKQLDLRLVQWKIFLPERWREACALNEDGNMDPNLTLAHITHNIAVVLLHQGIAYPSAEWQSVLPTIGVRLPSASSAETCLIAATEVVTIVERFLRDNPATLTNPQFAFCLFICGRMLLAHAAYYSIALPRDFDVLLDSLWEISKRWKLENNIAAKFASRLLRARQQGASLDIRQAVFSDDQAAITDNSPKIPRQGMDAARQGTSMPGFQNTRPSRAATKRNQALPGPSQLQEAGTDYLDHAAQPAGQMVEMPVHINGSNHNMHPVDEESPDSISFAFPPLPLAFQAGQIASATQTAMQSPAMQPAPYPVQDFGNGMVPMDANAFQDLNFFMEYSFPPDERVSMYGHPSDQNGAPMNQ
ncbi:putative c6 transcription [Diaporthe ampelina]|uniref:Putative c6 transcription n=1 Tax=Diaporthe ampelina TaxID=1214573 RepID=A0A0G2I6I5_9PEZI|nr:putative c6 transcription [Diaporthe ampelina]